MDAQVFPTEIWLKILEHIGKPRHASAYRLEPGCSHTLSVVSRVSKELALCAEPLLYARAFVTRQNVDLLAGTIVQTSDPCYNPKKRSLIKSLYVHLTTDLLIYNEAPPVTAIVQVLYSTLSRIYIYIRDDQEVFVNPSPEVVRKCFKGLGAAVHGLPHLEELCIIRWRYEPSFWYLQPEGRSRESLKRLAICDENLSRRLEEILSESPALETCIVGYSHTMGHCPGGDARLEDVLRSGQERLKHLKLAVEAFPGFSTVILMSMSKNDSAVQEAVRARPDLLRVIELAGSSSLDTRGDLIRGFLADAIADGSIWTQDGRAWDEYHD